MTFIRAYKIEIAVATLALVAHLVCFALVIHASGSILDAVRADDGFFELAENIRAGNGFSWSTAAPYESNALRTPGYPYVLAALISLVGVAGAALIQLFTASLLPVLGMKIVETITRSRAIAIGVAVILALDPTLALLSFQFYTETLFLLLFFFWIIMSLRYMQKHDMATLVVSAILLGCAILVKASAQYVPLLFILFILWQVRAKGWRQGAAHAGVYLLVVGAILAPWVVRNSVVFSTPGLSSQTAFVLYTNLAPAVLSVANGTDFTEELDAFLTEEEYRGNAITLSNGAEYTARALDVVRAHPAATLFVAGKSLFTFFTNDGVYTLLARIGFEPYDFMPTLIVARLVWVAITLAAFIGAFVFVMKERSSRTILILLLIAYFALTSTITAFGTNPRYRLPVDPIIIAFAVIGTMYLLEKIKNLWLVNRQRLPIE